MPKSKHRKKHKKKLAHRRMMQEHKKNAYEKKLQELYGQEIAKAIAEQEAREGGSQDPNDLPSGGIIGGI